MNVAEALQLAEKLYVLGQRYQTDAAGLSPDERDAVPLLYGEIEDVIIKYSGGPKKIAVETRGSNSPALYPTLFAAGFLSGRTFFTHQGLTELLTVIGKLRREVADPSGTPAPPPSLTQLVRILNRLRECCQYMRTPPANERDVQDLIWIMLRSNYDRVDREDVLPRFGAKTYRPDFGVPDLGVLVEAKYIGANTDVAKIQEEIIADVPGYLRGGGAYKHIVVLVYDAAQKLRDPRKFVEDLRTIEGIIDVIVTPGI